MQKKLITFVCVISFLSFSNIDSISASSSEVNVKEDKWKLRYYEDFSEDLHIDEEKWIRDDYSEDSPWTVDGELDDNGEFFHIKGGKDFINHLDSFWLMRKSETFGENDWLTAELATRNYDKSGQPKNPVSFDNVTLKNGEKAAKLDESNFDGGGLIRSSEPLPPEYRIEYKLKTIEFGGMRNGSFDYGGKTNGYEKGEGKTNFPWKASGDFSGPSDPSNSNFSNVTGENGFYFLSIVDYHNPAPHNNVFIHTHRKVNMDAYNVNGLWSDDYSICNPESEELYNYNDDEKSTRNGINALFMNGDKFKDHDMPYNEFLIETDCGSYEGDIVSVAEIQPELMPDEYYTFAIERDKTGYTMEVTGNFLHAGHKTLRFHRDFIEDDQPIFHYNNRPDQYDGAFDQEWDDGEYQIDNTWPEESAYPDYFIIGDPHLTHYEGSATISDIKLYVPESIDIDYMRTRVWQLLDSEDLKSKKVKDKLDRHLTAVEHYEKEDNHKKVMKHMEGFKALLKYQQDENEITSKAYKELENDVDSLLENHK